MKFGQNSCENRIHSLTASFQQVVNSARIARVLFVLICTKSVWFKLQVFMVTGGPAFAGVLSGLIVKEQFGFTAVPCEIQHRCLIQSLFQDSGIKALHVKWRNQRQ